MEEPRHEKRHTDSKKAVMEELCGVNMGQDSLIAAMEGYRNIRPLSLLEQV